jgi:predicted 2-oxoglutarate/Fe(II)-dependent dioxygenase YbiX
MLCDAKPSGVECGSRQGRASANGGIGGWVAWMRDRPIGLGEPGPWFEAPTVFNPRFSMATLGGRFVALVFLGQASVQQCRAFVEHLAGAALPDRDDIHLRFAVSLDAADLRDPAVAAAFPKQRVFHDPDGRVSGLYGALGPREGSEQGYRPYWLILDPMLRVYARGSIERPDVFVAALEAVPKPAEHAGVGCELWAPVLLVPRVLEPELCKTLIGVYESGQPNASGFMRTENGRTVGKLDPTFKRRNDVMIEDPTLRTALVHRIHDRLVPEIKKSFQFSVSRIERYIVACYRAEDAGFFRAHRDNTTAGTAHRRFAVTINLNAEEHDGGELRFPEFGPRSYKAPTGGAIVFSCSLLHEALPVTRGLRYATLPFLYDDKAAAIRRANQALIDSTDPQRQDAEAEPEAQAGAEETRDEY